MTVYYKADMDRLRALRLWHWRAFIEACDSTNMGRLNKSLHLGFVQTLNDFFPLEDTAEQDAKK